MRKLLKTVAGWMLWVCCTACAPTLHLSVSGAPMEQVQNIETVFLAAGWRVERMNPRFFPAKDRRQPMLIAGDAGMFPELLILMNQAGVPAPQTAVHTRFSHRYSPGHAGLYFPPADERNPEVMSFVGLCGRFSLDMVFREAGDGLLVWSDWEEKTQTWRPRGAEAVTWRQNGDGFDVQDESAEPLLLSPRKGWSMDDHFSVKRSGLPESCSVQPLRSAF